MKREFRSAWIATVDNIDWPSERGLHPDSQKVELLSILDRAVALNLNAVILQVRPAADALYDSAVEPWSEYLTGQMGLPPDPFYDPLRFAIESSHDRGLEIHAWVNPFRAHHPSATGPIASNHVSKTIPGAVKSYGEYLWLDPASAEAMEHSLTVILDIVRRYDVDGIHMDDYFYPYPVDGADGVEAPFPDADFWNKAVEDGFTGTRSDWRRSHVDQFVERLYQEVKAEKPWVKVGISPFGIWRPGHPPSVSGFDAYDRLYADARRWVVEGWLDYVSPQLYWPIDSRGQNFADLLEWWIDQNEEGRHVWPGLFTSRTIATGSRKWTPDEIVRQVETTRSTEGSKGNIHFSAKALMSDRGSVGEILAGEMYAEPALVPASPWLDDALPTKPELAVFDIEDQAPVVVADFSGGKLPWLVVVQSETGSGWESEIITARRLDSDGRLSLTIDPEVTRGLVHAISRTGMAGPSAAFNISP